MESRMRDPQSRPSQPTQGVEDARHARLSDLFERAMKLEPAQRGAFVETARASEPSLGRALARLVEHASDPALATAAGQGLAEQVREFLRLEDSAQPGEPPEPDAPLPERIGQYLILRRIGRGGMGVVYEAQQQEPRRRVALKVIAGDAGQPERRRRFRLEGELLGLLDHPGIARIIEAGVDEQPGSEGRRFLVMELIQGLPLLEHARAHDLSLRDRLELMRRVCEAAHHAHLHGIVHRDLKPDNILVTPEGQPKILDFGVARAVDGAAAGSVMTATGEILGTLAYMSPEQLAGDVHAIDARTDVHALGVITYELLSGRRPHAVSNLPLAAAARVVQEEEASPLSRVDTRFRGDVETIVGKALEKDMSRRYESAGAMAEDLRRFLADEPIKARPASTTYQVAKFARRHKVLVAGVAGTMLALIAGTAVSLHYAVNARKAREVAEAEAETARQVSDFLDSLFAAPTPGKAQGEAVLARDLLDEGARRIEGALADRPAVQARLLRSIGTAYSQLGMSQQAIPLLERAVEQSRVAYGSAHDESHRSSFALVTALEEAGQFEAASTRAQEVLDILEAQGKRRTGAGQEAISRIASLAWRRGRHAEAEAAFREVLAVQEDWGHGDEVNWRPLGGLGVMLLTQGKLAEAETMLRRALAGHARAAPDDLATRTSVRNNLAIVTAMQGRPEDALGEFQAVLDDRRRLHGLEHPVTLLTQENVAYTLADLGRHDEAAALYEETIAADIRVLGPKHPETLRARTNQGRLLGLTGRPAEGADLIASLLPDCRQALGASNPTITKYATMAACLAAEAGRTDRALALLREAAAASPLSLSELEHPSLRVLEQEPEFEALLASARSVASASP